MINGLEEVIVPITVKNNQEDDIKFAIEVQEDWITTRTRSVELEPGEEEIIELEVKPSETEDGLYKISVEAELEHDNKVFTEEIKLNLKERTFGDFFKYIWYFLAGLVLLVIGIVTKKKASKKEVKKVKVNKKTNKKASKTTKKKESKKINISVPKKKR